jgi:hypothetical protein
MKFSSIVTCTLALVLGCASSFLKNNSSLSYAGYSGRSSGPLMECVPKHTTKANKVTVFLHGLMVGYMFKEGNDKKAQFEVGIVKRAPDHQFAFHVYSPSDGHCEEICVPELSKKTKWVFEVQKDGSPISRNIARYQPSGLDLQDYKYILPIEDLHKKKLERFKKTSKQIFYFRNGIVKSESLTSVLYVNKPDGDVETPARWGPIAEVVGVEVVLRPGERLVCSNLDDPRRILWVNEWASSGEVEGRLTNLPPDHQRSVDPCTVPYLRYATPCADRTKKAIPVSDFLALFNNVGTSDKALETRQLSSGDRNPTHFQFYYYLMFKVDIPDRFELINQTPPVCYEVIGDKVNAVVATVPPYRCGMVLVSFDEIQ